MDDHDKNFCSTGKFESILISIIGIILLIGIFIIAAPALQFLGPAFGGIYNINQPEQPPAGYGQTFLFGGSWAGDTIRHDAYFINISQPDTLKMVKTYDPGCPHAPFSYFFEFLDKNNTAHTAQVNILQSGDEIGGPWYDGNFVDNWHERP